MTVYLDSVFALNFAVNWLLLRAAARLGAAAVRPRRIAAAAALGAAYALEGRPTPGSPRGGRRESWAPSRGRSRG